MNFKTLDYFITLAEERNFTRAAAKLFITQQSLSSHIAAVEEELGCRLILRNVPLELTYAGEVFLRYAQKSRNDHLMMLHEIQDISQNKRGKLRIGIAHSRSQIFFPELILAFQKVWPDFEVDLYEVSDVFSFLLDGNIDLAISYFPKSSADVVLQDFYQEQICLVVGKAHLARLGISVEALSQAIRNGNLNPLADCPFILGNENSPSFQAGTFLLANSSFQPKVLCSNYNTTTSLKFCLNNMAACFSPKPIIYAACGKADLEALEVLELSKDFCFPIRFGYLKKAHPWSIISEFIRIAKESYPMDSF